MDESRVSSRYAKSLLDLAREKGLVDQVEKDMRLVVQVGDQNPAFVRAMKNPIVKEDKKIAIIRAIFKGKVSDLTLMLFELLAKKTREGYIYDIAKQYLAQYRIELGIQSAEVVTTFPLTEDAKNDFKKIISAQVGGKKVELKERIDESIIGGYILKIGDTQIDQSIREKLHRLKTNFKDTSYISKL